MFNLRKYSTARQRRGTPVTDDSDWRLELKPVQVDSYHNLHAICHRGDGSTSSELLMTHLTRAQAQTALSTALRALKHHFDDEAEQVA